MALRSHLNSNKLHSKSICSPSKTFPKRTYRNIRNNPIFHERQLQHLELFIPFIPINVRLLITPNTHKRIPKIQIYLAHIRLPCSILKSLLWSPLSFRCHGWSNHWVFNWIYNSKTRRKISDEFKDYKKIKTS